MNNGPGALNLLVPLLFLVLWALSQVFNREQPTPQRRPGMPSALGPRPGTAGSGPFASTSSSFETQSPERQRRPASSELSEGLVIVGRGGQSGLRNAATGGAERRGRRRGKPSEAAASRVSRPGSARPAGLLTSVATDPANTATTSGVAPSVESAELPFSASSLRGVLRDPERVREIIVLNALLAAPPGTRMLQRLRRR